VDVIDPVIVAALYQTVVIKARLAPEHGAQFLSALRAACTLLHDAERDSRESCPCPIIPSIRRQRGTRMLWH
jgi:hypothetical protein